MAKNRPGLQPRLSRRGNIEKHSPFGKYLHAREDGCWLHATKGWRKMDIGWSPPITRPEQEVVARPN